MTQKSLGVLLQLVFSDQIENASFFMSDLEKSTASNSSQISKSVISFIPDFFHNYFPFRTFIEGFNLLQFLSGDIAGQ